MIALTVIEAVEWCRSKGLTATRMGEIRYTADQYRCIEVSAPKDVGRLHALGYSILMASAPADVESDFEGGLIWVTETGVSSPTFSRIGSLIFESLRVANPPAGNLFSRPARLAARGEIVEMQTLLFEAMAQGWDAYVIPAGGQHIVFVSHDDVIRLQAPKASEFEALFGRMEQGGWLVRERTCAADGSIE